MTIFRKVIPYIVILGVLSYVFVTAFGMDNHLLIETTINGIKFYKFDLKTYISGIQDIWKGYFPSVTLLQLRTDVSFPSNAWDILGWFKSFVHNWALAISWQLYPLYVLTYVGNFVIFAIQMILSLLGFPTESTLLNFMESLKQLANAPAELINGLANLTN